jgi:hypothetical protein
MGESMVRWRRAFATTMLAALASCSSVGGSYDGGGGGGYSRRDERQFIGSFSDVRGVGVSRRFVYAATPAGIAVYDRILNAWLPPLTRDNGLADDQITVLAGDPVEDAMWLGVPGAVIIHRPGMEQTQRTMIIGVPDLIVFDRGNTGDALVRAGGQWTRVSRVGVSTPLQGPPPPSSVVVPSTLQDVYERFPQLRGGTGLLLREQKADRPLRNYPVTSGSISPERASEVWLGTNGDGLYRVDPTFQQATGLRFGPIESGIGALAIAADGVWTAGLGQSAVRSGLSFASNDLQRWRWIDGTINVPLLGVRANAMSLRATRAWIATDRGVVRARLDGSDELMSWTSLDGLPDDRVYSIAARAEGAWAGTARGLVFLSDSLAARNSRTRGIGARMLENNPVYALLAIGDTLWAGTAAGLVAIPSTGTLMRPVGGEPALRRPIRALAWSDTVLLASSEDAIVSLSPRSAREPSRIDALDPRIVGGGMRLAIDDRSIVVAGPDGVIVMTRSTGAPRLLRVPSDIPAPVLDIAMSRDWLWVATAAGLARFRRAGDGGLP